MTDSVLLASRQPTTRTAPWLQNRTTARTRPLPRPTLRFTPAAWAKLTCLRDAGPTEIGGFGIARAGDLLLVEDVHLVRQTCDWASVAFDDTAVAAFFDEQVDAGRSPAEFARIWVHTHPGNCPQPSLTDEETFERVFGGCDWAVMFILARGGQSYARLQFGVGPRAGLEIPVSVEYGGEFSGSDQSMWLAEYATCVTDARPAPALRTDLPDHWSAQGYWRGDEYQFSDEEADDDLLW